MRCVEKARIIDGNLLTYSVGLQDKYDALGACDVAMLATQSCALEAICLKVPAVIIYTFPVLGSRFASLGVMRTNSQYVGLPNMLAGKQICPEIIGEAATPSRIKEEVLTILRDRRESERITKAFEDVRQSKLGRPGMLSRISSMIVDMISSSPHSNLPKPD